MSAGLTDAPDVPSPPPLTGADRRARWERIAALNREIVRDRVAAAHPGRVHAGLASATARRASGNGAPPRPVRAPVAVAVAGLAAAAAAAVAPDAGERHRAEQRRYSHAHRDSENARKRAWEAANPEAAREWDRRYNATHQEEQNERRRNRRARKRAAAAAARGHRHRDAACSRRQRRDAMTAAPTRWPGQPPRLGRGEPAGSIVASQDRA